MLNLRKPRVRLAAISILWLMTLGKASAEECIDYATRIHWVGAADVGIRIRDVVVRESRAYVGDLDGVVVLDISLPAQPAVLARVPTPRTPARLSLGRDVLCAQTESGVVYVIDVTNPASPRMVGTWQVPSMGTGNDLVAGDGYAYAACPQGVYVLQTSTTQPPAMEAFLPLSGYSEGVALGNGYLYVASAGVHVVDVANPGAPQLVSTLDLGVGVARDVAYEVDDHGRPMAYVIYSGGFDGLVVVDMSNPSAPVPEGVCFLNAPGSIAIEDGLVVVETGMSDVKTIDVLDPENPRVVGSIGLGNYAGILGVAVGAGHAYLAADQSGFHVIDVSAARAVLPIATLPSAFSSTKLAVNGQYAYEIGADVSNGELRVIDLEAAAGPTAVAAISTPNPSGIALDAPYVYFMGQGGLRVANVANPEQPVVTVFPTIVGAQDMALDGDRLFMVSGNTSGRLKAVDISSPNSPMLVEEVQIGSGLESVAVEGGFVYCGTRMTGGLAVFDVRNPEHMEPKGQYPVEFPYQGHGVAVAGGYVYLTESWEGAYFLPGRLEIFSIAVPSAPVLVGRVDLPTEAKDVAVVGDVAYVAADWGGIYVIDISDPMNPSIIGGANLPRQAMDVTVDEGRVLVACGEAGLQVLPAQCSGSVSVPNPTLETPRLSLTAEGFWESSTSHFSFEIPEPGHVSLDIYDVAGRLMRHGLSTPLSRGHHAYSWDRRDQQGRRVASGIYFARLTWNGESAVARVALVR